jgi:hypothetical protein
MALKNLLRRIVDRQFHTQESLSPEDVGRGYRMVVADGICSMAMATLQGGPFLASFALAIGASNYEVGLLASIGLFSQLMQLPGLYLVTRYRRRRALVTLCAGLSRLLWIFILLIPLLFFRRGISFLIQWLFIAGLIGAVPGPAWNSLLRDVLPHDRLGHVFSRRMMYGTGLSLVLTLAGGYFIDAWKTADPTTSLYAYSVLFFVGLLFGLLGVYSIARMPEPLMAGRVDIGDASAKTKPDDRSIPQLLSIPMKDENFRRLMYFTGLWNFIFQMVNHFFSLFTCWAARGFRFFR